MKKISVRTVGAVRLTAMCDKPYAAFSFSAAGWGGVAAAHDHFYEVCLE
jgi:hypothetical protein